jgi:hypothetical protein
VKILLDCSPAKIEAYRARYRVDFGQLRTPLTNYKLASEPVMWAADNGFFSSQDVNAWLAWVDRFDENRARRPKFVTLPDIVCDAARTIELFEYFKKRTNELPRALVLQNGIERERIPWNDLDAIFIGGDDQFKYSPQAMAAARTAKILGRWVHVGRMNTAARVRNWLGLADSIDGSGISRFDHMLEDVLAAISGQHPQQALLGATA